MGFSFESYRQVKRPAVSLIAKGSNLLVQMSCLDDDDVNTACLYTWQ